MVGELVTLPVRIGVRVTRAWFRALEETVSVTTNATGRVLELLVSRSPNGARTEAQPEQRAGTKAQPDERAASEAQPDERAASEAQRDEDSPREAQPGDAAAREPRPSQTDGAGSGPPSPPAAEREPRAASALEAPTPPAPAEPVHVSEEPVLVEEFAEPGAEQGAGAEVHVNPPWDGYEQMNAKQIIARLTGADPSELAAVQLYEETNRRRQTVINAVERELRTGNSRTNQRR